MLVILAISTPCYAEEKVLFDETRLRSRESPNTFSQQLEETAAWGCSGLANLLRQEGYGVSKMTEPPITGEKLREYDVLVILTPNKDYSKDEVDAIDEFVKSGGGLLLDSNNWYGYRWFAANGIANRFGLSFADNGYLLDEVHNLFRKSEIIKISDISPSHPITNGIKEIFIGDPTYIDNSAGSEILARTNDTAWFDRCNGGTKGNGKRDSNESGDRYPVVAAKEVGAGRVLFLSGFLFTNGYIETGSTKIGDNRKLVLNIINWLSEPVKLIQAEAVSGVAKAPEPIVEGVNRTGELPLGKSKWERKFGGKGFDIFRDVQLTEDGGCILAGSTESYGSGGSDLWVIRTDSEGREQWNRSFGSKEDDEGSSIQQTLDGGFIVAGSTRSSGSGGSDIWVVKLDSKGNEEWDRTFGGPKDDAGFSVKQTKDSGYVVAGYTTGQGRDLHVIKIDSDGNKQWDRTFGKQGDEEGRSVDEAGDGYIVAGYTTSFGIGGKDVWLVRLASNGSKLWDVTFGNPLKTSGPAPNDVGNSVEATKDGFIIAGSTESGTGNLDLWLIKTNLQGNKEWERMMGGKASDEAFSIHETQDGGYVLAGRTGSYGSGGYDAWLVKTSQTGYEMWNMTVGGSDDEAGYAARELMGGYVLAGLKDGYGPSSDAWLVKVG
jgi:predicted secreted protein